MKPTCAQATTALDAAFAEALALVFKSGFTSPSVPTEMPDHIAKGLARAVAIYETFSNVIANQLTVKEASDAS